jgi:hypothetical protein
MSTRSGIGIEFDAGSVAGVYCHYDGYPEGVGKILDEHYRDRSKVESLVCLGSISSLDQKIGEKHPFNDRSGGWTTFYGRDRGESGTGPRSYVSREEFRAGLRGSGIEFFYLLSAKGDWQVSLPFGRWRSLSEVLAGGVALLGEQDPDRGADILTEKDSSAPVVVLRGATRPGRDWLERYVSEGCGAVVFPESVHAEPDYASTLVDGARRDGLIVEEDWT